MVVISGNYFIEQRLTQKTASKFSICMFQFFPKGHFNVYDRVGRGTGTTLCFFKPYHLYKIHRTKQYALTSFTIMFYLEDMVVQKGKNFIQFICILP